MSAQRYGETLGEYAARKQAEWLADTVECHACHGVGADNYGGRETACLNCSGTGRVTPECNADEGHPCDAFTSWMDPDTRVPCPDCAACERDDMAEALRSYRAATPAERDPAGYAADMRDAGRGHLLREEAESRAEMVDDARDRARDEAALRALAGHR